MKAYLGLGKTLFHSSAAAIWPAGARPEISLAISERLLRKKSSGAWPEAALQQIRADVSNVPGSEFAWRVAENRDVRMPHEHERGLNRAFPFFNYLEGRGLGAFTREFNTQLEFVTHHRCHALAAALVSPFDEALIVVVDGAGTRAEDFTPADADLRGGAGAGFEEASVYRLSGKRVDCVWKRWQVFVPQVGPNASEGIGLFYESAAEHIFNNGRAAGKVMGLAALCSDPPPPIPPGERVDYLRTFNRELAFHGGGKAAWESSKNFDHYVSLAATAQSSFEQDMWRLVLDLRRRFPEQNRIILTGGCALNCTFNGKLVRESIFDEVYVPPFPGDESIGLGAAAHLYLQDHPEGWGALSHSEQHGYFGPRSSQPLESVVREVFSGPEFQLEKPASIVEHAARILADGNVIAWFQGRSESGPRALGHRSLLARPDRSGLKGFLNSRIKFRESFRPYGASVTEDHVADYFDVPANFHSPYMSFAMPTRADWRERLGEITHVDGTCRFQTVARGQCPLFHALIESFGRQTGLHCLLNTSLNVMGEPIVESPADARRFLLKMAESRPSPVHGLAIGDFYVRVKAADRL